MPLLKSRKSIYSLYQRLGDEEESDAEEEYEKFSSTISSEFTNINQICNFSKDSSCENSPSVNSIEVNVTNDNSTQSTSNKNIDNSNNKNVNETTTKTMLGNSQKDEITSSLSNISNLSIDSNKNYGTNIQGTSNDDIYDDVTEENIYACIDEDIYATVNDSIDNNEDNIYATVEDTTCSILNKRDKKSDIILGPSTNDKYDAIAVLDSVVKDDNVDLVNKSILPEVSKKPNIYTSSESERHPIPSSEKRKILIPVRKAPPPPVKPSISKTTSHANSLAGRKKPIKRVPFPPDVIICKESIYQIPTVKYSTLDSKNDNISRRSCDLKPYDKHAIRKPRESRIRHESLPSKVGSTSPPILYETSEVVPKNPILDISFESPIVHHRENRQTPSSEAPPLPPKVKTKCEGRPVSICPVSQSESTLNTSGMLDRNPIKQDPPSTYTGQTPIEDDDMPPGCSPQILRDLRHGLMKSERPLRESAIFYTKAQPYPGNHSPGADTKKL